MARVRSGILNRFNLVQRWYFPLMLALLVRLVGISWRPIWYDEAFALLFAKAGPSAMLYGTLAPDMAGSAADIHPLGYYTLLWGWMKIFGSSVVAGRALSILLGMGVVALVYVLGKQVLDPKTAWWGALFAALSPFLVHYSQEVRMYALLALACLGAAVTLWQGIRTGQVRWWVGFAVCSAVAQYTHHLAVFFLVPLAMTPVWMRSWRATLATFLAGLAAVGLYLPWLVQLPAQLAKVDQAYWTAVPGPARLVTTLLSYVTNLPLPPAWLPLGLFVTFLVIILAAWQTVRAFRFPAAQGNSSRWAGLWLAYLAFSPAILLFLVSQFSPVYIERALTPSAAILCLWLAFAFRRVQLPRMVFGATLVILFSGFALGLDQHLFYAGFPYAPYETVAGDLSRRLQPGDVVVHSNKLTMFPMVLADPGMPHVYLADLPGSGSDTLARPTQEVLGYLAIPTIAQAAGDASRVWLVMFDREVQEYASLEGVISPLAWLSQHYHLADQISYNDLTLYVFERSP